MKRAVVEHSLCHSDALTLSTALIAPCPRNWENVALTQSKCGWPEPVCATENMYILCQWFKIYPPLFEGLEK